jgi:hypothetical protein
MKTLVIGVAAAVLLLAASAAQAATLHEYKTELGAQKHCPTDTVVWGSPDSGVFHMQGTRFYGKSKGGHYVCMGEALKIGMHAAANGQ